ncbi:hypothetical protein V2G26_020432 [Clonostachys chloroleuca]
MTNEVVTSLPFGEVQGASTSLKLEIAPTWWQVPSTGGPPESPAVGSYRYSPHQPQTSRVSFTRLPASILDFGESTISCLATNPECAAANRLRPLLT